MNKTNDDLKKIIRTIKTSESLTQNLLILSFSDGENRAQVKEFYGKTFEKAWHDLYHFYTTQSKYINSFRIDVMTEEKRLNYAEFLKKLKEVKRNNYIDFNLRIEGLKKRSFLKEELVANAILKPSKNHKVGYNKPELQIDERNFKGYVNRKYNKVELSLDYLKKSDFYLFHTESLYFSHGDIFRLRDYGYGNRVREINSSNFFDNLNLVITEGGQYLANQLEESGQFIYGYYPTYDQKIKGYNSVRHFSSLYALAETAAFLNNKIMLAAVKDGLQWGIANLSSKINDVLLIKDLLNLSVEYKLGAQATAILAFSKYSEITGDKQFYPIIQQLIQGVEKYFISSNAETTHVLNEDLTIKEKFRIVYYDGEILFALLRAYELLKDPKVFETCQKLMDYFVVNHYEKYHDHWLSYAINEFLKYEQKEEYYLFGVKNVLDNMRFIEKRDTAYPTLLELLVAAAKMMLKLEQSSYRLKIFNSEMEFQFAKEKVFETMTNRAYHEMTTGVMFPEFAQFFKKPNKITFGFFTRHDRFRMRIDDAEHFLSGLVNYYILMEGCE
ncbi:hypothetical protein [Enterococcus canintestini]